MTPTLGVYFGLLVARVGTFVAVMPLFAGRTPKTVRAALALVLSVFFFGAVTPGWDPKIANQAADIHWLAYAMALLREAVIGASIGFIFSLFLLPMQIAGDFITQQIGLALSPQSGLATNAPTSPYGMIFEAIGSLLFLELDGHHIMLATLHASFDKLRLGGTLFPQPLGPALDGMSHAHQMGMLLAGPLGLCLFLLTVVLAIMTRAAPQLNIYSVGFTLQVTVALLGCLFLMPDMIRLMIAILGHNSASVDRFLE